MTTEATTTTAQTKEELYNAIGKANIELVSLDEQILTLEENLKTLVDEPDFQLATQQSIREARQRKTFLEEDILRMRRTIRGRLELEVEHLEKAAETEPMKEKISMIAAASFLKKEIETLKKLTAYDRAIG